MAQQEDGVWVLDTSCEQVGHEVRTHLRSIACWVVCTKSASLCAKSASLCEEGEKNLGHLAPPTPFSQNTTSTARRQFRRSNSGSGVLGVGRVNATRGCGSAFAVLCHLCDHVCQNCMSQALRLSAPCGLASVPLS